MNIKQQLISGVIYNALAKYSGIIVSLVVAGVLSRLLPPSDFGIVAVATVLITFFTIFTDLGISPAIIQNKTLEDDELNSIFSYTIFGGVLISILFFIVSPVIAIYYENEELKPICWLLSINLLFAAFNIVPNALLYKNKRFQFIAARSLILQVIGGVISVMAAYRGAGVYALLINPILTSILLFLLSYKEYPLKFRLFPPTAPIKKIFNYSLYQFMFNLINYFTRNLDKLMIGRALGMSQLGLYDKSYRLMMLPLQNITQVISPVMHPIFSELQNDMNQLTRSYQKVVMLMAYLGFPLSVLIYFTSRELILLIFGTQWVDSIASLQILSFSVGFQIILSSSGAIFQAANDTKTLFISGVLSTIVNVAAIIPGLFYYRTIETVAIGVTASFIFNFFQCYLLMYLITLKQSLFGFAKIFLFPFLLSFILIGLMWGVSLWVDSLSLLFSLLIKSTVLLFVVLLFVQFTNVYDFRKLKSKF